MGKEPSFPVRFPRTVLERISKVRPKIEEQLGYFPSEPRDVILWLVHEALKQLELRPDRSKATTATVDVLRVLDEAGRPLDRREVAKALGISNNSASQRLARGIEQGLIERVGVGQYQRLKKGGDS